MIVKIRIPDGQSAKLEQLIIEKLNALKAKNDDLLNIEDIHDFKVLLGVLRSGQLHSEMSHQEMLNFTSNNGVDLPEWPE